MICVNPDGVRADELLDRDELELDRDEDLDSDEDEDDGDEFVAATFFLSLPPLVAKNTIAPMIATAATTIAMIGPVPSPDFAGAGGGPGGGPPNGPIVAPSGAPIGGAPGGGAGGDPKGAPNGCVGSIGARPQREPLVSVRRSPAPPSQAGTTCRQMLATNPDPARNRSSRTRLFSALSVLTLRCAAVTRIRAVLFDFGGVISTSPFEAFARFEQAHGLPLTSCAR